MNKDTEYEVSALKSFAGKSCLSIFRAMTEQEVIAMHSEVHSAWIIGRQLNEITQSHEQ